MSSDRIVRCDTWSRYYARGNTNARGSRRHIIQYDGICADSGMVSDRYGSQQLRAGTDYHVATQPRNAAPSLSSAQSDLLKKQTIRPDLALRMHDHTVRVRQQQASRDPRIERNIGAGRHAPDPVAQHCQEPLRDAQRRIRVLRALISPDAGEKRSRRIPGKEWLGFPRPIRVHGRRQIRVWRLIHDFVVLQDLPALCY